MIEINKNIFSSNITTRYCETDQGGRIYHSNYLVWLDITRTQFLASIGLDYDKVEEEGYYIVVKKVECDYIEAAKFNQVLTISINHVKCSKIKLEFNYEISHNTRVIARAYTKLAFINKVGKLIPIPEKIINKLDILSKV